MSRLLTKNRRLKKNRRAGFSSIEAVVILALLGVATLGMGHTVITGQRGLRYIEDDSLVLHQAQILMSRLSSIPFGTGAEGAPNAAELIMLLGVENDMQGDLPGFQTTPDGFAQVYTGANIALTQIRMLPQPLAWQYVAAGEAFLGTGGLWEVFVDRDLNGDGDLTDPMEVATQTNQDLCRIEIRYEGRRVLRTVRTRNPIE